jgi:hypothetical protein
VHVIRHRQPRGVHEKVPENTLSLKAESHEETGICSPPLRVRQIVGRATGDSRIATHKQRIQ